MALFVPFVDACILEYAGEHDADFAAEDVADIFGSDLGVSRKDRLADPVRMLAERLVGSDLIGDRLVGEAGGAGAHQDLAEILELLLEAGGQDREAHDASRHRADGRRQAAAPPS